ncbi:hypothetical protein [Streptomyces sp. SID8499]|uniref:hypothetical protein n=1 Tax=Streptomyces sp. SID8499 TaxID=2706106 RepID=UPI0013CCDE34|nr:hypothetical protein [Streptomyces sp. SID8499]NED31070.1 hypothetical protein [Streptomyces sp. SID8499]
MSGKHWKWTLVIQTDEGIFTFNGETLAPANSTEGSILPGIAKDVRNDIRGRNPQIVGYTARPVN